MNVILRGREGSVVVAQSCHEGNFSTNTLSLSLVFVRVFFLFFFSGTRAKVRVQDLEQFWI